MPAAAQESLACGDVAAGFLSNGDVDSFRIDVAAGTVGFIQGSFTSDTGDTLSIRVVGDGVDILTCSNFAEFASKGGPLRVEVSPCHASEGEYLINFGVTSSGPENCGFPLPCGATPDGLGLEELGEVDTLRFPGLAGGVVELRIDDADDRIDPYLMRVFDPRGKQIARVCGDSVEVATTSDDVYTVLVSACGALEVGDYRLERFDSRCPRGPVITSMAFLPQDREFVLPVELDAAGRAVYESSGNGTLIVEGRVGQSLRGIGGSAFASGSAPDFQAIVSRPLGNGNPAICDQNAMPPGGIAATRPFAFFDDRASIDRINDLGCRFDNGQGDPVGRRDALNSCVRASFSFVDPTTDIQFCADFAVAERFPVGDTVLSARMRDLSGVLGAPREIVVRVEGVPVTPTLTPTPIPPTPTRRPPTHTPTPRPTRPPATRSPGPCTGDCDGSGRVRISELTRCVRIALGTLSVAECRAADRDEDGVVMIGELVEGVNNALLGCPPEPIAD